MTKIALFADVQNVYYTTRQIYNRQFDYRALWQRVSQQGEIIVANAYATQRHDENQQKFQNALAHIGFDIKLKPFIQRNDGSAKGDWDVGIAIDVMRWASKVDVVVLLSGDGDFDLLLEAVCQDFGVRSEVYGVPELTAQSLKKAADAFHPILHDLLL